MSRLNFAIFVAFVTLSPTVAWSASGITYHGRIVKPSNQPLESATTRFRIQIKAPDAGNCVLWEEEQTRNMLGSNGVFSITIGDSADITINYTRVDAYGWSIERVFSNRSLFSGLYGCTVGNSFLPNPADGRVLEVSFKEAPTDPTWEAFPATKINLIPMALNSLQLEGYRANEFLKIDPYLNQTPITNAGVNTLLGLIAGTSTLYVKPADPLGGDLTGTIGAGTVVGLRGRALGAAVPAVGQVLKFDGTSWVPSADDTGGAPADSSYAAKGVVQFDTSAAVSGVTVTAGVARLADIIVAGGPVGTASVVPVITYDAKGRLTAVTTAAVNDVTKLPLAGGTMTGPINMGTQNITNATSVAATNFSGRNFVFNDNDTNTATLRAPVDITANYNLTLPVAAPTNGYVLSTDAAGQLSWITAATGSVTSVTATAPVLSTAGTTPVISLDTGLLANKVPQVGGTALGANGVVVANGLGTALTSLNCAVNQVIKFDASGFAVCGADDSGAANAFVQNGNTFGAAATLGTNDNFDLNLETNGITKMTIQAGGNVGIGTISPTEKLHIQGTSSQSLLLKATGIGNHANLKLEPGAITGRALISSGVTGASFFFQTGVNYPLQIDSTNFGLSVGSGVGYAQTANSAPANGMIVQGSVGIGTSAPFVALTNSSINTLDTLGTGLSAPNAFSWVSSNNGYVQTLYNSSAGGSGVLIKGAGNTTNSLLSIDYGTSQNVAGTPLFRVLGNGNVGIGTTNPQRMLSLASGDIGFQSSGMVNSIIWGPQISFEKSRIDGQDGSSGYLAFATNETERMRINFAGNVGIGTTNPSLGKLDIDGGTQTTSLPILNGVQTWNAGGVSFTAAKINVTDTASSATSKLLDLQVGGASRFSVDKTGRVVGDGSGLTGVVASVTSDASNNTKAGTGSLNSLAAGGIENTAYGYNSLNNLTTGDNNVAVGRSSASAVNTGSNNIAVGMYSMGGGGDVSSAVAIGTNAMGLNSSNYSVAIGENAMFNGATSTSVAIGFRTLETANSGALYNVAVGSYALTGLTTGDNNTAFGYDAGRTSTPANEVTTGSNNTFIGYDAGPSTATQLSNATAIGAGARVTASNSLVLGNGVNVGIGTAGPSAKLHVVGGSILATGTTGSTPVSGAGSRFMWIPSKSALRAGEVGLSEWDDVNIGQHSAAFGFDVVASGQAAFAVGDSSTASGFSSMAMGTNMTVLGTQSFGISLDATLSTVTADNVMSIMGGNIGIGTTAPGFKLDITSDSTQYPNALNIQPSTHATSRRTSLNLDAWQIGQDFAGNGTKDFYLYDLNSGEFRFSVNPNGNVGIGVTGPTSKLQVAGNITPDTTATKDLGSSSLRWNNIYLSNAPDVSSDARLKKDVQTSDLGLDFINSLRPVSWTWKDPNQGTIQHYGLIAQEAESAIARLKGSNSSNVIVSYNQETDSYSIRYTELISPLIKAVQEIYNDLLSIKAVNDTQDLEIAAKDQKIKELELRLERIEESINSKN